MPLWIASAGCSPDRAPATEPVRLFAGVELDVPSRHAALTAIDALSSRMHARWIDPANLHVTVRFVGEVVDGRAQAIVDALAAPVPRPPFDARLGAAGAFPTSGPVRVAWIGLPEGRDELTGLHDVCNARLRPFGHEPDARPFAPHLTIARFKDLRAAESNAIRSALSAARVEPVRWRVEALTIFRSHLSPRGARYEPIARATLVVP